MRSIKTLILVSLLLGAGACGEERHVEVAADTGDAGGTPAPSDPTAPAPVNFASIQVLTNKYCISCHANDAYLRAEAAFRSSDSQERVANRTMPIPGSPQANAITEAERKTIVAF